MENLAESLFQNAVENHEKGDLSCAEKLYLECLQKAPQNAQAKYKLGILYLFHGKLQPAQTYLRDALLSCPLNTEYWVGFVNSLLEMKDIKTATDLLSDAKLVFPSAPSFDAMDAKLEGLSDPRAKPQNKVRGGNIARHVTPTPHTYRLQILLALIQAGHWDEANKLASRLTRDFPTHEFAWKSLGHIYSHLGDHQLALKAKQKAVNCAPHDAETYNNLALTHNRLKQFSEAERQYHKAIKLRPDYIEAIMNCGLNYKAMENPHEAVSCFRQAISLNPGHAPAYYHLGLSELESGALENAKTHFSEAIKLQPDYAEAHRLLSNINTFKSVDPHIQQMEHIYDDARTTPPARCHLGFALGKAYEDLGEYGKAFSFYQAANHCAHELSGYDITTEIQTFSKIRETFPKIQQQSLSDSEPASQPVPIYIFGMPRSGTSLVEQILSSHSKVWGAGELGLARHLGENIATGDVPANTYKLKKFKNNYLSQISELSHHHPYVTDKMPSNFQLLGLLMCSLPQAKFIHVVRDPGATCWGIYKQFFVSPAMGYSYKLTEIVTYYRLYQELMRFWTQAFPERIFHLNYDKLTQNQEEETKRLIQYLQLDWEDKCLCPEKNYRQVGTASKAQVRKKVYQGSSQKWLNFKPFLNGAFDQLDTNTPRRL